MLNKLHDQAARPGQIMQAKRAVWPGMQSLADGTDSAVVAGTRYWSSIEIPELMNMTGIGYLIGTVGLTSGDKVIVELHDSSGEILAASAIAGTAVGAAGVVQNVPFLSPLTIKGPGVYHLVVQFNTAVPKIRTLAAGTGAAQTVITGSVAGTFGTPASIVAPGTTFTAGVGPIAFTY